MPVDMEVETIPERDEHEVHEQAAQSAPQSQTATSTRATPSMTPREQELWAMNFEELYQQARRHDFGSAKFGKGKSESRKSGRVRILKWILKKEGITPYTASQDTAADASIDEITASSSRRNQNGAIDHPEAILSTSDPALQQRVAKAEVEYLAWSQEDLTTLAMQRSYQIFKDSAGKMPTRAKSALAHWLAAWDVLKSEREKKWWLGDGIDLVNKAKAMGYEGKSTKKYDVIVWLRSTPEEADVWAAHVAEPTAIMPRKRKADGTPVAAPVSKRPAKGSQRPGGWKRGFNDLLEK